jgi:hypothetical protein
MVRHELEEPDRKEHQTVRCLLDLREPMVETSVQVVVVLIDLAAVAVAGLQRMVTQGPVGLDAPLKYRQHLGKQISVAVLGMIDCACVNEMQVQSVLDGLEHPWMMARCLKPNVRHDLEAATEAHCVHAKLLEGCDFADPRVCR